MYEEERDWWTPPTKLGIPKLFDLIVNPREEHPDATMRNSWVAEPALKIVVEVGQSLRRYPPIAPGTPDPCTPPKS